MLEAAVAAWLVLQPPARFDYPNDTMTVLRRDTAEIIDICGRTNVACAYFHDGRCFIVIPHKAPESGMIYRHERAHCNGWPRHHPTSG